MKVLVIGSNSFSGSDFIDLLLEDESNEVVGISRSPEKSSLFLSYKRHNDPRFKFYQLNLNDDADRIAGVVEQFKPEYVVNFAAQSEVAPSWDYPEHWFQTNTVALASLIKTLRRCRHLKRYVHISSPEVYGSCKGQVLETAPLNPTTPYAASKAAADLLLFTYVKNFDFPLVIIRSTNVYGPHQQLWKIIPRSIIQLRSGRKIALHGGGKAMKSYIHIRDISRGELAAMINGTIGSIYHLSPDGGISVRNVVEMICRTMGCEFDKSTIAVDERLGQDAVYVIDSTKARSELKWLPEIEIQDGIKGVIQWIERDWSEVQKQSLEYVHRP